MKGRTSTFTHEARARALAIADDKGIAAAAKATGVSGQTISNWRLKAKLDAKAKAARRGKTNGHALPPPVVAVEAPAATPAPAPPVPSNGQGNAIDLLRADLAWAIEQLDRMRPLFEQVQRMRASSNGAGSA